MAGGKETPRQKMIGMMYLVLTALLALNVSASIMEKFAALNTSLKNATTESQKRVSERLTKIEETVKERGNQPGDVDVLTKAKTIQKETDEIVKYIADLKDYMVAKTDGYEEGTEKPKAMSDRDVVAVYMLGGNKDGKAYELEKKLNTYADNVNKISKMKRGKLALSGAEDPLTKNDPDHKNWDFASINFEETPLVAALAVLSNFQNKVASIEAEVVGELAEQVGATDFKLNDVFPVVRAESRVVAAGTKYKAEMFLSGKITGLDNPKMEAGGLTKVEGGVGYIEFKAVGGAYDKDGKVKKSWQGKIIIPNPKNPGADTTLSITEEYFVANPVLQVQSASVQALYLNCGNKLQINCPALGTEYDPKFSAAGASVQSGKDKGQVVVIPSQPKVTLTVSSGGTKIDDLVFQVRKLPLPTIEALNGNKPVDEKRGVQAPGPRQITMKAIPDESFKAFLPEDARYRITKWEATLVRGKRPVEKETFTTETGNFGRLVAQAKENDRILIEVLEVRRMNFKGEQEVVKGLGAMLKNIPITD